MDKELKARKLASASVRKQRGQEREKHRQMLHEQREERKRRMMRMSEIYHNDDSDSDSSRPNSPENDSSADTPSEHSLRTPGNSFSPKVEIKGQSIDMTTQQDFLKEDDSAIITKPTLLERRRSRSNATRPAMFTSSLNRPCDFRYDRYSTIVDPVDLALSTQHEPLPTATSLENDDESEESEEDSDEEDDYSPIELATPVAIRMPISRPSVVSVVGATGTQPGPQKFLVTNINTIMINPPKQPTPKPRIIETVPTPSSEVRSDYGFPVTQARSAESTTPSSASIVSVEPSSTRSLPAGTPTNADASLKKKSSMPMLTKFTHARMHSLKNFMKPQSISGPPPAVPIIPSAHQARPSESLNNILLTVNVHKSKQSVADKNLPPSPRRSLTEPNIPKQMERVQRPQTARNPSQGTITGLSTLSQSNISALPPPIPTFPPSQTPKPVAEEMDTSSMTRKKSFPSFRRRSGSLGQALKFGSGSKSKPATPDEPLPPMPIRRTPTQESLQPTTLPTPPARTPRQVRKSGMMYSPFPPPAQKGEPVGLGLRM